MILISRNKRLVLNVPVFKINGFSDGITFQVSGSPGLNISFTPPTTSGTSDLTLIVKAEVTASAALGDNYIEITGAPLPRSVKRLVFTVSEDPAYWDYQQWSEA